MSNINRAMILAAGRGKRMRPLTDSCPKPLLPLAGKPLIEYHLNKLVSAGISNIVINHAWLGEMIEEYFGNGEEFGCLINYSSEQEALETAGGIIKALPLLGDEPFIVVNGDIWSDCDYSQLTDMDIKSGEAHLFLIENPDHNPNGDFIVDGDNRVQHKNGMDKSYTFSGIGIYSPEIFRGLQIAPLALIKIFNRLIPEKRLNATIWNGRWCDVGTPERLKKLEAELLQ